MAGVSRVIPAAPFAKLSRTTNQTVTSGGFGAQMLAVTSTTDNGVATTGTAMNDTTNSRIYARRDGIYSVMAQVSYTTLTNYKAISLSFSDGQAGYVAHAPSDAIFGSTATIGGLVLLSAGTYITATIYHQKGTSDTAQGFLMMGFVGRAV